MNLEREKCPICEGSFINSTTTHSVEFGYGVLIVRHVPVYVCESCSNKWFTDEVLDKLDEIENEASKRHDIVVVKEFNDAA